MDASGTTLMSPWPLMSLWTIWRKTECAGQRDYTDVTLAYKEDRRTECGGV